MKRNSILLLSMLFCLTAMISTCSDNKSNSNESSPDSDSVVVVENPKDIPAKIESEAYTIDDEIEDPENEFQSNELAYPYDIIDGWLKLDVDQATILEKLGQPDTKGEDTHWGALGTYVQEWTYTSQGISLNMESDEMGGAKHVLMITLSAPSKSKTSQSISIGSTKDDVLKAYADKIESAFSEGNDIVVGSIYGGVIFSIENNLVTSIFVGAAAE